MSPSKSLLRRPLVRILVIWLIESFALVVMAWILDGMAISSVGAAVAATALIGLLNAVLWPLLSYILLPFAVLTLGLFSLVLNGLIIWLASLIIPDSFVVEGIGTAIWAALGMTVINVALSSLLTIDDDSSWYRNVVRRRMRRRAGDVATDVPGVLFLEIDGLAEPVLEQAMREGYAPTMKRWLESGSHRLVEWETDLSSQTSASQAGLLHGNNHNIPAFRWYERRRKKIVASSDPDEVARMERELSDGNGLLIHNGVSRGNLLSGDAPRVMTTASTMKDLSRLHVTDFYAYFINPYNFSRTLVLGIWDVILEKYQFWQARRKDVQPRLDRHHRGGKYPLLRVFTTIFMREINIYTLIGDMYAGVDSAYATFVGYDEVAHHSGVESADALDILRKLDEQFARLENAAKDAPRPYHFVILSDHGQSGGATFKQRYGKTLQEVIQDLARHYYVQAVTESNEDWGHVNIFLTDAIQYDERSGGPLRRLIGRRNITDGEVQLGPDAEQRAQAEAASEGPRAENIAVLASGNLGLVYEMAREERMTLEEMEAVVPGLLEGLANHEGIGWLMVNTAERGPVVIGPQGRCWLAEDRIEGKNPLQGFGPNAAAHLLRYNAFPDAPDVYVNSFYDVEQNEVAAFEELIGCHGGMGGYQTRPFILFPAAWELDEDLVGAAAVYRQFKHWLVRLQGGPAPAEFSPGSS